MTWVNFARALAGAVLVLALAGCVRLDLRTTLTDHGTADGTLVVALADDAAGVFDGSTVTWRPDAEQATRLSARGPATPPAVGPDATEAPAGEATPTPEARPAEGVISDWGVPVAFATFLVLVVGGLVVGYMVSRRQHSER